ncbi:MAG: hypothetical protein JRK53_06250 [Deltaproteobacteria bacterium]|nr:hypothetical protein [Deltaproteobacteria bacterium]MBW1818709.1 hypothetical protein [Deltaproteobacteria bacterium]MBW2284449.1 hypothetical protein [Deltaproteobacteria bacterium]
MLSLEEIKQDKALANDIDWDMTPEEAVTLYLEWGNNWSHGKMVKSRDDVSHYFVVNTWDNPPMIYLVRRNSDEAVDLALISIPDDLREDLANELATHKGVYGITPEIRKWLKRELLEKELAA